MKTTSLLASAGSAGPFHTGIRCYHKEQSAPTNILLPFVVFLSTLLCNLLLISVYHFLSDNCYSAHNSPLSPAVLQYDNTHHK